MAEQPYNYDQVNEAYAIALARHPETFGGMNLRQFSTHMNQALGTDKYKVGAPSIPFVPNFAADAALLAHGGLKDILQPASESSGRAGESFGGLFGETGGRIGKAVGESLPMAGVNLGLIGAATALGGPAGLGLGAAALGNVGAETFSETGSVPASVVSAATLGLLPFAGRAAGSAATKFLTPQLERFLGKGVPRLTEGVTRELGEQAGVFGAQQVGRQASSLVQGQGFAPITAETLGHDIAGNIPFLPFSVPRLAKGSVVDTSGVTAKVRPAGFRDLGTEPFRYQSEPMAREVVRRMQETVDSAAAEYNAKVAKLAADKAKAKTPPEADVALEADMKARGLKEGTTPSGVVQAPPVAPVAPVKPSGPAPAAPGGPTPTGQAAVKRLRTLQNFWSTQSVDERGRIIGAGGPVRPDVKFTSLTAEQRQKVGDFYDALNPPFSTSPKAGETPTVAPETAVPAKTAAPAAQPVLPATGEVQPSLPLPGVQPKKTFFHTDRATIEELAESVRKSGGDGIEIKPTRNGRWELSWYEPQTATVAPEGGPGNLTVKPGIIFKDVSPAKPEKPKIAVVPGGKATKEFTGDVLLSRLQRSVPVDEWGILDRQGVVKFLKGRNVTEEELTSWLQTNGLNAKNLQLAERANWQVTVQKAQKDPKTGKEVPGFVQIDDTTGGVNVWSKSPQTLKKEGQPVLDFYELPQGKYTYAEAVKQELLRRRGFVRLPEADVQKFLKTLENEGASPEKMVKAAEALTEVPAKSGETPGDVAAREAGLDQAVDPSSPPSELLLRTHRFFDKLFELRGETGAKKDFLVRNAIYLASKFETSAGKTLLGRVLEGESFFAPKKGAFDALIGIHGGDTILPHELENLRILWDFSHELTHNVEADIAANPKILEESAFHRAYAQARLSAEKLSTDERAFVMNVLSRHAVGAKSEFNYKPIAYLDAETPAIDVSEFLADYSGLIALGSAQAQTRKLMADYSFFANKETQEFVDTAVKDLTETYAAVRELLEQQTKAALKKPDEKLKLILSAVDGVHKNLVEMQRLGEKTRVGQDAFRAMTDRMMTSVWDDPSGVSADATRKMFFLAGFDPKEVKEAALPKTVVKDVEKELLAGGVRPTLWQRLFPMTQIARWFAKQPLYKTAIDTVQNVPYLASEATYRMTGHWTDKDGKWDAKRIEKLGRMQNLEAKAFTHIGLLEQFEEKRFTRAEIETRLKEKFPSITKEQIDEVDLSLQQAHAIYREGRFIHEQSIRDSLGSAIAMLIQNKKRDIDPNKAARLGLEIANLAIEIEDVVPLGPAADALTTAEVKIRTDLGDSEIFEDVYKYAKNQAPGVNNQFKRLRQRDYFMTEVRFNKWFVSWRDAEGKQHFVGVDTQQEAQKRLEALNKAGNNTSVKVFNKEDQAERWRGQPKGAIQASIEADQRIYDATYAKLVEDGADQNTLDRFREQFKPGDGALQVWTPPYMLERSLVAGREELNMIDQMLHYIAAVSYGTARKFTRQKMELILGHPQLKVENPALGNSARRYATELLDSRGREFTEVKNFIFLNTLAFNISSNIVNMAQNFMVAAPLLIKYGATFGGAFKDIMSSVAEVGKAHLAGKSFKFPKFSNAEHGEVVNWLEERKIIDKGQTAELFAEGDMLEASRRSITMGTGKIPELLSNGLYHIMRWARNSYGFSEQINQRAAGIAGYDFARKQLKLSKEQALHWAADFVKESNFGGGTYNRPEVFNGLGRGFGVGGVVYSMNGYAFNLLSTYARMMKESVQAYKGGKGLTSKESQALATMLAAQGMAGGLMGLPLVGAVTAVIEQLFPNVDAKKTMREGFASLGGDDEEMGHFFADLGMAGVFNATTNTDVGSRFQLSTFLGVDPYKGFEWQNLAGPIGGILENFKKAAQLGSAGQISNAAEKVMPSGLRGLWRMMTEEGGFRDPQGRLIIEPTATEQALTAIGFRPKRLAQFYEKQELLKRSEATAGRQRQNLYSQLADKFLSGDVIGVRAGLLEMSREALDSGGVFDPREGLEEVVKLAQQRKQPTDLTRASGANVREVGEISRLYPQGQVPSETELYLQRKTFERIVPLPGAGQLSAAGLREAQAVDQLMKTNPRLTREEARVMVSRAMRRAVGMQAAGVL